MRLHIRKPSSEVNSAKFQTAGAIVPEKLDRHALKKAENAEMNELVDDLETSISVNMQLMHDIVNVKSIHTGEDTETCIHFPGKVYEKLLEQKRRLESAIGFTSAQRNLCSSKIKRSEEEAKDAQSSEEKADAELYVQITEAQKQVEEKENAIQIHENTLMQLESEFQLFQHSKAAVIDLPGFALRISRLTHTVARDQQLVDFDRQQIFDKCKVRFNQSLEQVLEAERSRFPTEFRSRNPAKILQEDFGLGLTYEGYLIPEKSQEVSLALATKSAVFDDLKEAKLDLTHMKSKSVICLPGENQGIEPTKMDSATGKLEELCLAVKMKGEEIASLRKLSSYLDSQKVLLTHKMHQIIAKKDSIRPSQEQCPESSADRTSIQGIDSHDKD